MPTTNREDKGKLITQVTQFIIKYVNSSGSSSTMGISVVVLSTSFAPEVTLGKAAVLLTVERITMFPSECSRGLKSLRQSIINDEIRITILKIISKIPTTKLYILQLQQLILKTN